jgi:hypothetical protein
MNPARPGMRQLLEEGYGLIKLVPTSLGLAVGVVHNRVPLSRDPYMGSWLALGVCGSLLLDLASAPGPGGSERVEMSNPSARRRWRIRAIRHLTIQSAAFVILLGIAVLFAIDGHWAEAAVFALLAMVPEMVLLALVNKMRRVSSLQYRSGTTVESV